MSKPIPGPWIWTADPEPHSSNISIEADGETIAVVAIGDWDVPIGSNEATARLICAAPDLFRELIHLVRLIEPLERNGGLDVPGLATLNGARAAIAKAKGGRDGV